MSYVHLRRKFLPEESRLILRSFDRPRMQRGDIMINYILRRSVGEALSASVYRRCSVINVEVSIMTYLASLDQGFLGGNLIL